MRNLQGIETNTVTEIDEETAKIMEKVMIGGDLGALSASERVKYYGAVCKSLGLNPLTKPFEYIKDDKTSKLSFYVRKEATEQIRSVNKLSIFKLENEIKLGSYVVTAHISSPDGRTDIATGAVPIEKEDGSWSAGANGKNYFKGNGKFIPIKGEALTNAIKKAETQAKRRATLSIMGLGVLDESEVASVPNSRTIDSEVVHTHDKLPTSSSSQQEVVPAISTAEQLNNYMRKMNETSDLALLKTIFAEAWKCFGKIEDVSKRDDLLGAIKNCYDENKSTLDTMLKLDAEMDKGDSDEQSAA